MVSSYVFKALLRKYTHMSGELEACNDLVAKLREDLIHLEAVIRLFRPQTDVKGLPPVHRYGPQRWLRRAHCAKTALEVLRDATEPMTAREIALEVMQRRGVTERDEYTLKCITNSVRQSLQRREVSGVVSLGGGGKMRRWSLPK
jgi:hypothetical protein